MSARAALLSSVVTCDKCNADTLVVELAENNPGALPCVYRRMNWADRTATRCRLVFGHACDCLFDGPWSAEAFAEDMIPPGFASDDYASATRAAAGHPDKTGRGT